MTFKELYKASINWYKDKTLIFTKHDDVTFYKYKVIREALELYGDEEVMFFDEDLVILKGGK